MSYLRQLPSVERGYWSGRRVNMMVDEKTAIAESVEASVLRRVVAGAPQEVRARFGISSAELDGGVAIALASDPSGYWSKALGLGVTQPVTERTVAELAAFYEANGGAYATVQIAPEALPANWESLAPRHGISEGSSWVKLIRSVDAKRTFPNTALRVGLVPSSDLDQWAHVLLEGLGMPHELDGMFAATDDDAFRHVAAWDGELMVAAATLYIDGAAGHLFGASTLPGHRGQGAQSALVDLRVQEAAAAGVEWLVAETWKETEEFLNPSLHNLKRAGFQELYVRPNWVWERDPQPGS